MGSGAALQEGCSYSVFKERPLQRTALRDWSKVAQREPTDQRDVWRRQITRVPAAVHSTHISGRSTKGLLVTFRPGPSASAMNLWASGVLRLLIAWPMSNKNASAIAAATTTAQPIT